MMGLFRRRSRWAGVNLLDLRPKRCVEYRAAEDPEKVVLLVPRFRKSWTAQVVALTLIVAGWSLSAGMLTCQAC